MPSQSIRRPSPALIVGVVALVAALAGSAVALPGKNTVESNDIKKNAVKSKQLKNNGVKGTDVDEASLGAVPNAQNAANAANAALAQQVANVTLIKRTSDAEGGDAPVLATVGPFTLRLDCRANAANTEGFVLIETTEANSFLAAIAPNGALDPGDAELDRRVNVVADAPGGTPSAQVGWLGGFGATAPSGASIEGGMHLVADADSGGGTCTAWGQVTRVG